MNLLQTQVGINLKTSKCSFRPSRQFTCLGFDWDTAAMTCSVPRARLWEAQRTARRLIKRGGTPLATRDLARFVGKVTAMTRGVTGARRYLLYVQQQLGSAVRDGGFTGSVILSPESLRALEWWAGRSTCVDNAGFLYGKGAVAPHQRVRTFGLLENDPRSIAHCGPSGAMAASALEL